MNRPGEGGSNGGAGLDDVMGLMIGAVGALCVWLAAMVASTGGAGSVQNPDGELRWFSGTRWISESEVLEENRLREGSRGSEGGGRLVVLVHGLDEPGGIWDDAAPALYQAGYRVVRFEYPNDQSIVTSATGMRKAMERIGAMGFEDASIVAHSMGGLVSREALTNPELGDGAGMIGDGDDGVVIDRLILVGTPNEGSAWAKLRGVAEVRERVQRWVSSDDLDPSVLTTLGQDGDGQAGKDLQPGSAFLESLNARAMPAGLPVTCVIGRVISPLQTAGKPALDDAARSLGDGVVSVESGALDGCDDVVLLVANHRSLLRVVEFEEGWRAMVGAQEGSEPGAIGVILDRLSRDQD